MDFCCQIKMKMIPVTQKPHSHPEGKSGVTAWQPTMKRMITWYFPYQKGNICLLAAATFQSLWTVNQHWIQISKLKSGLTRHFCGIDKAFLRPYLFLEWAIHKSAPIPKGTSLVYLKSDQTCVFSFQWSWVWGKDGRQVVPAEHHIRPARVRTQFHHRPQQFSLMQGGRTQGAACMCSLDACHGFATCSAWENKRPKRKRQGTKTDVQCWTQSKSPPVPIPSFFLNKGPCTA